MQARIKRLATTLKKESPFQSKKILAINFIRCWHTFLSVRNLCHMIEANGFDNLDDIIIPIQDNIKKIKPLLDELIILEKKLNKYGVKIEVDIRMNHLFE